MLLVCINKFLIRFRYFEKQIELISATNLPVFFHCRAAHSEFVSVVSKYRDSIPGGVVSNNKIILGIT